MSDSAPAYEPRNPWSEVGSHVVNPDTNAKIVRLSNPESPTPSNNIASSDSKTPKDHIADAREAIEEAVRRANLQP